MDHSRHMENGLLRKAKMPHQGSLDAAFYDISAKDDQRFTLKALNPA